MYSSPLHATEAWGLLHAGNVGGDKGYTVENGSALWQGTPL